jgi:NADH-quinone oxidoreductase subunit L
MGGWRKSIPLVYVCFLVGGAASSALPIIPDSFFSKKKILAGAPDGCVAVLSVRS